MGSISPTAYIDQTALATVLVWSLQLPEAQSPKSQMKCHMLRQYDSMLSAFQVPHFLQHIHQMEVVEQKKKYKI